MTKEKLVAALRELRSAHEFCSEDCSLIDDLDILLAEDEQDHVKEN